MSAARNKQLMQEAFADLAHGDGQRFVDLMADDFVWRMIGTNTWSGTYTGKSTVRRELLDPLFAQFADRYQNHAVRFIAEDDFVVVECRGRATTRRGKNYANTYCFVCRFEAGRMKELTEYMDTALVAEALEPRTSAAG